MDREGESMIMKIVALMEDTKGNELCMYEHGLSLYIETQKHHLLFDTGASEKTIKNAQQLGIDLRQVDTVILSHGHYDHAGGIIPFSKINPSAKIWMQKKANKDYYHGQKYIGIDKQIMKLPQFQTIEGNQIIDEELFLFTHITGRQYFSASNLELTEKIAGNDVLDSFDHEQCLVINEGQKHILLSGCAHNGIMNIIETYKQLFHGYPDVVISGFHLCQKTAYTHQEVKNIQDLAHDLKHLPTQFYTGHCTGQQAYLIMKDIMKDKLHYLHCGDILS